MSGVERDLRDALEARAVAVRVGAGDEPGLGRRLAAARRRRRARLGSAAVALLMVFGTASVLARNGDEQNVVTGPDPSSTSTSAEPSTTTTELAAPSTSTLPTTTPASSVPPSLAAPVTVPRTTSTTAPLPALPDDAIWPAPGTTTTFATPGLAAADFTRRFLGMGTPQFGAARVTGDNATVDVRPLPTASLRSVVSLRRVGLRGWVVVGCAAPSILIDQPTTGATITSPLTVRGRAQAFEGTVDVEVRRDGATAPLGTSFGTGGGDEVLPYEATVSFSRPTLSRGTIVVSEARADDGSQGPAAATVIRVAF